MGIRFKETFSHIQRNPWAFNSIVYIFFILLFLTLATILYVEKLDENEQQAVVVFDVMHPSDVLALEAVIHDSEIAPSQWVLHDSLAMIRKDNFESLLLDGESKVIVNLDIPESLPRDQVVNNLAIQAVNYAQILNKRAPYNLFQVLTVSTSEKDQFGIILTADFDYKKLLEITLAGKFNTIDVLKYAVLRDKEMMSQESIKLYKDWCSKASFDIEFCREKKPE